MEQLDGRVAAVTGAASGIGLAVSEALAREGTRVLMLDLDRDAVEREAARVAGVGGDVEARQLDVRDPDAVDAAASYAVARFGALHIAVNNAGIVNGGPAWELDLAEWHRVLDVNLWGVIHGIHAFVPRILATGEEGHVVNTGSMASVTAIPNIAPYVVAKHGVLGLSDVLRAELDALGAPVGVSVVMPGMIRTGLNPMGTVEPTAVAANVVDAIRTGRPYVFTDDHHVEQVERRLHEIMAARSQVIAG
jgi:NAD(P)-dependent dehydrogenase (short-subunit alcohol dehydrogenase family)